MSSDFQGEVQLATAAAAVLVTSGKEKPRLPQAFGPEVEPVKDLALPLLEDFNQHLPSPLYAVGLYVQWVQASFLKQRSEHVCWLIPVLLPRLFPEYFTFLSMTQPGSGTSGLDHLIIQIHHTLMIITQVLLNPITQVPESRIEPVDSEGSTIAIR